MIEPQRRRYEPAEQARLVELFGDAPRWGETLRPFLWTHVGTVVTGFTATTEIDLPITCTYDFEVAAAKYLHGLDDGEIPLLLLFSGTVFRAATGRGRLRGGAGGLARGGVVPPAGPGVARRDGPLLPQQRLGAGVARDARRAHAVQGRPGPAHVGRGASSSC